MTLRRRALLAAPAALAAPRILRAADPVEISFLFPVAVGGPITAIIDGYARAFEAENAGIKVRPIYSGSYQDTLTKAQTQLKSGDKLTMAVLLAVDVFTLVDQQLIVPVDEVAGSVEDKAWIASFYPAFLANGRIEGHTWSVPFQRSTIVLFWNKDAFKQAGLDPEKPPANWTGHADAAAKLTRRTGGEVQRWGVEIPGTGFTYWLYQALATEAGATLVNAEGTETKFDSPEAVAALRYWVELSSKYQAHPPGLVDWGTTPRDFLEERAAMIWTTTGNLSNIRKSAKFPFGVGMLPEGKRRGSPTGGGNFYLFRAADPRQREAALQFLRWITAPERAAQWSVDTGYVATRPDAYRTEILQKYVAEFPPAAVARDQLQYAVPELSTHDNQRVTRALDDELQAALTGTKAPEAALGAAQANATRILRPYR